MAPLEIPTGYTPGPWKLSFNETASIQDAHGTIARLSYLQWSFKRRDATVVEGTAKLIALAPQMADEIKDLRSRLATHETGRSVLADEIHRLREENERMRSQVLKACHEGIGRGDHTSASNALHRIKDIVNEETTK